MRRYVASCAVLIVYLAYASAPAEAQKRAAANPLGVTIVRFDRNASPAQIKDAVIQAGGEIVTDLTKINAVAAVGNSSDFASRMAQNSTVRSVWTDRLSVWIPRSDAAATDVSVQVGNKPALGSPGATSPPDPFHNASSFLGETNPEGILQWDDNRMDVPPAWITTLGDRSVRVAVLDTGVQGSHKELLPNYDNQTSANMIPCNLLTRQDRKSVV